MYNLRILLKNNYNLLIGRLFGKKQNVSSISATLFLVLGVLALLAMYTLQAYGMYRDLSIVHLEKVCLFHAILPSLSVIVVIGIIAAGIVFISARRIIVIGRIVRQTIVAHTNPLLMLLFCLNKTII